MIAQEQQAAAQREMQLRERREMLMQRRLEREQENQMLDERRQMAEQLETQRAMNAQAYEESDVEIEIPQMNEAVEIQVQNDVQESATTFETQEYVEPVLEVNEMQDATQNEGYVKLAEYLSDSLNQKKAPKSMVNELKMAKMMGMFSQEILDEVLSQDFDELVNILSGIRSNLRSPKSRIALKSVMEGLKK